MAAHVPQVVQDLQKFTLLILTSSKGIPKQWRSSLAQRLEGLTIDTLLIMRRYALLPSKKKVTHDGSLTESIMNLDHIETLLGICHDLSICSDALFGDMMSMAVAIRKQLFGLQKSNALINRKSQPPD